MRRFALLAVAIWFCGCNSRGAKTPETAAESGQSSAAANEPASAERDGEAPNAPPSSKVFSFRDSEATTLGAMDSEVQTELRHAEKLANEGQWGLAVEALSRLIGDHPKTALAFVLRARVNSELHHDADALADFSTAIELEPKNASHYKARGMFQLTHGNTSKALADCEEAVRLDPNDAQAFNHRGLVHNSTGETKLAVEDFSKAIKLDPKNTTAYSNRSMAYARLDRRTEALADLDRAIQIDASSASSYQNRGVLRYQIGEYENAIADFTNAIRLDGSNPGCYASRREAYLKLERYAEAQADGNTLEGMRQLSELNNAVLRDPRSPKPYLDRGNFCMAAGQPRAAIPNFDRAVKFDAKNWFAYAQRARAWIMCREFQKAVDDCTSALAIERRDEIYGIRGDAYRKLADYEKALADYEASQRFDTDVAETWQLHSQALREAGKIKEADDAQRRANDLVALATPTKRPAKKAIADRSIQKVGHEVAAPPK